MTPFRIEPRLPVTAVKTFQILAPRATHFRPATCAEVNCPAWLHGWQTAVDESTELGQRQAYYIRHDRSRRHREQPGGYDAQQRPHLTVFTFEPGQRCFAAGDHRVQVRPELFIERGGDHRGNPRGERRVHARPGDWAESFALHQQDLADRLGRG